ncbi:hypothetical protein MHK_005558 [Candidatus Magnetomorum sp. HK-1]|nr:hypothetical protein MHK_005558 [Candidatus Magnetomorum sp. HK-1]
MDETKSGRTEALKRIAQIKREQARIRSSKMQFVMNKPKPRVKES